MGIVALIMSLAIFGFEKCDQMRRNSVEKRREVNHFRRQKRATVALQPNTRNVCFSDRGLRGHVVSQSCPPLLGSRILLVGSSPGLGACTAASGPDPPGRVHGLVGLIYDAPGSPVGPAGETPGGFMARPVWSL